MSQVIEALVIFATFFGVAFLIGTLLDEWDGFE